MAKFSFNCHPALLYQSPPLFYSSILWKGAAWSKNFKILFITVWKIELPSILLKNYIIISNALGKCHSTLIHASWKDWFDIFFKVSSTTPPCSIFSCLEGRQLGLFPCNILLYPPSIFSQGIDPIYSLKSPFYHCSLVPYRWGDWFPLLPFTSFQNSIFYLPLLRWLCLLPGNVTCPSTLLHSSLKGFSKVSSTIYHCSILPSF